MSTARVLDGKQTAKLVRAEVREQAEALRTGGVVPGLAVVLVGDDPASAVYVRNKERSAGKAGIEGRTIRLAADTSQAALLEQVDLLNDDPAIHGILVQLPLPAGLDAEEVVDRIDPAKDVDGLHAVNAGRLMTGRSGFVPCTPAGVIRLLDRYEIPIEGRRAVVIGRSHLVGKPVAQLLLGRNATVTMCHSRTKDLAEHTRQADIVIVAVGRPQMVKGHMIKAGAVVVDVGIHRTEGGGLHGDVDFDSVNEVAGWLTPVPGGVGPMTIAMLLHNTVVAAQALATNLQAR